MGAKSSGRLLLPPYEILNLRLEKRCDGGIRIDRLTFNKAGALAQKLRAAPHFDFPGDVPAAALSHGDVIVRYLLWGAGRIAAFPDPAERVARDLPKDRTLVQRCDVAKLADVQRLVSATTKAFGHIDVLVNNAGVAVDGDIAKMKPSDWDRVMDINARGTFHGCQSALPHLVKTGGCIVNTASVSGLGGDWGMCVYDASKGAIVNLTRALALDYGGRGVRVNSVCPSLTPTPMAGDMKSDRKAMAKFRERVPLGRAAEPEDIAAVITFLASPDAAFITGFNLPVDGGVTASNGQPSFQ